MNRTRYDAIVIGAGPAGTAAAITLGLAGHQVLLVEKSRFPREKLCGEFLTPESRPILTRLGVEEEMLAAGAALIEQFNLYDPAGRCVEIPMRWIADGAALGITRGRMDRILLDRAIEVGVEVREEFTISPNFRIEGDEQVLEGRYPEGPLETLRTTITVDASGRHGAFSRQIRQEASRLNGARLFGCKVHLQRIPGMDGLGELFFFGDGYGGLSDVEEDRSNLCFLTTERTLIEARGDREKLLDLTVRTNPAARARLAVATAAGEWHGTGPITYGRQQTMAGVLTVGDASAFIDPFTGSGMLLALSSGELAAQVIDRHLSAKSAAKSGAASPADAMLMIAEYHERHRSLFSRRYRAVSLLRRLAFQPATRQLMVSLLSRQQGLARLIARSTRAHH
ncbi:MAG: NAD(P)/FAD-dependent oxidoreductase [Acidobacteriota bacterium]